MTNENNLPKIMKIIEGPSKSDLIESLFVGSKKRGIQRPHFEITYIEDNQQGAYAIELMGLIRISEDSDLWQFYGRTMSYLRDVNSRFIIARYSSNTRKGGFIYDEKSSWPTFFPDNMSEMIVAWTSRD